MFYEQILSLQLILCQQCEFAIVTLTKFHLIKVEIVLDFNKSSFSNNKKVSWKRF